MGISLKIPFTIRAYLELCLKKPKMLLTFKKSIRRKKYLFGKKIKSSFKAPKSQKMTKTHF
jgi:hypothetical protein